MLCTCPLLKSLHFLKRQEKAAVYRKKSDILLHSYKTYCIVHESTALQPLVTVFWLYRVCIFKEMYDPLAKENNPIKLGWGQQLLRLDCNNTSCWKQRVFINEKQITLLLYAIHAEMIDYAWELLPPLLFEEAFTLNFHHMKNLQSVKYSGSYFVIICHNFPLCCYSFLSTFFKHVYPFLF